MCKLYYYPRLKDLREDKDLNQEDVANILGTDQSYYAKYENGIRPITFERAILLAKYYNVSLDYIAGLTNDKRGIGYKQGEIIRTANIAARSFDNEQSKTVTSDFSDVLNAPESEKKY